MKKVRKGFTLIELLLVIAIIGILSVMGMIAGQETTSAARATVIADNLEKLKTAGEMFYSENSAEIDKTGTLDGTTTFTIQTLVDGINAYLNDNNEIKTAAAANQYFAALVGSNALTKTWWVGYQFAASDGNEQIMKALVNKTHRMGLTSDTDGTAYTYDAESGTGNIVYLKIR